MPSFSSRTAPAAGVRLPKRLLLRRAASYRLSDIAPLSDELVNCPARRLQGVFASMKNRRPMPWRTREQRDLMSLLEVEAGIISYETWPERVTFLRGGRREHHVPTFGVQTRSGYAVVDAFPSRGARSAGREQLIDTLEEVYAERGTPYCALSGTEIRLEPRLGNARWVLARLAYLPSEREQLLVIGQLTGLVRLTIAELKGFLPDVEDVPSVVCALAVNRHLSLDLSAARPELMKMSLVVNGV